MRSNQWFLRAEGRVLMGKNKPLVNFKDSRGILLGRKMRSERNQRLKVIGQVTVTWQEFFSFCCTTVLWLR